jgi:FixJ family two-component response regulator
MASSSPTLEEKVAVVIVEDNVDANHLLRDWLSPRFQVSCFYDAEAALRQLTRLPADEPIVFLIDYNLPGDNGLVLKKKLVPIFPEAKFVLVSGLFDEKLTADAKAAGFHALLPKPFGMPTVTRKIETLLGLAPRESLADLVKRQTGRLPHLLA